MPRTKSAILLHGGARGCARVSEGGGGAFPSRQGYCALARPRLHSLAVLQHFIAGVANGDLVVHHWGVGRGGGAQAGGGLGLGCAQQARRRPEHNPPSSPARTRHAHGVGAGGDGAHRHGCCWCVLLLLQVRGGRGGVGQRRRPRRRTLLSPHPSGRGPRRRAAQSPAASSPMTLLLGGCGPLQSRAPLRATLPTSNPCGPPSAALSHAAARPHALGHSSHPFRMAGGRGEAAAARRRRQGSTPAMKWPRAHLSRRALGPHTRLPAPAVKYY